MTNLISYGNLFSLCASFVEKHELLELQTHWHFVQLLSGSESAGV